MTKNQCQECGTWFSSAGPASFCNACMRLRFSRPQGFVSTWSGLASPGTKFYSGFEMEASPAHETASVKLRRMLSKII